MNLHGMLPNLKTVYLRSWGKSPFEPFLPGFSPQGRSRKLLDNWKKTNQRDQPLNENCLALSHTIEEKDARKVLPTAMISSAGRGNTDVVKNLLDAGADVNAISPDHQTAKRLASARGYSETVQAIEAWESQNGESQPVSKNNPAAAREKNGGSSGSNACAQSRTVPFDGTGGGRTHLGPYMLDIG